MSWLRMAWMLVHDLFRDRVELALENLALRRQLACPQGPGVSGPGGRDVRRGERVRSGHPRVRRRRPGGG